MKIFATAIFLTSAFLVSCNSEDKAITETTTTSDSTLTATPLDTISTPVLTDTTASQPTTNSIQSAAPAMLPAPKASAAGALNPAHGQPGHRCDIAVGAPLNSAPAAAPVSGVAPSGPTLNRPTIGARANGTARLNPPHGQLGHDCGTEVGKPLKQ